MVDTNRFSEAITDVVTYGLPVFGGDADRAIAEIFAIQGREALDARPHLHERSPLTGAQVNDLITERDELLRDRRARGWDVELALKAVQPSARPQEHRLDGQKALCLAVLSVPEIIGAIRAMGFDDTAGDRTGGLFQDLDAMPYNVLGTPLSLAMEAALGVLASDPADPAARDLLVRCSRVVEAFLALGDSEVVDVACEILSLQSHVNRHAFDAWGPNARRQFDALGR